VGLQAKQTESMRQELLRYILKSFPAIDSITMTAMQQASETKAGLQSMIDQSRKQEVYQKALDFYELAAKLPPTNLASRTIIARAHYRIGFTHAVIAHSWGKSAPLGQFNWPKRHLTFGPRSQGSKPCLPKRPWTSISVATLPMHSGNGDSAGVRRG